MIFFWILPKILRAKVQQSLSVDMLDYWYICCRNNSTVVHTVDNLCINEAQGIANCACFRIICMFVLAFRLSVPELTYKKTSILSSSKEKWKRRRLRYKQYEPSTPAWRRWVERQAPSAIFHKSCSGKRHGVASLHCRSHKMLPPLPLHPMLSSREHNELGCLLKQKQHWAEGGGRVLLPQLGKYSGMSAVSQDFVQDSDRKTII